jgi:hypothetical protein
MTLIDVYARERVEEVRSRLALLETSVTTLKYDAWHVFASFFSAHLSPPFIFPTATFSRLEKQINASRRRLDRINIDSAVEINRLSQLKQKVQAVLLEFIRLQNVLTQRISGIGLMSFTDFQPIQGIEYSNMAKAYNAVDALTFELVERILGKDWIKNKNYSPICLFDMEYAVDLLSYAISVPYYDNYRSRFWPALAHEVSHVFVDSNAKGAVFGTALTDGINRLTEILGFDFSDRAGRYYCGLQVSELTSDIIASYVCPPSFLTGAFFLNFSCETPKGLKEDLKEAEHPPIDSRLSAMGIVLQKNGVLSADQNVKTLVKNIQSFIRRNDTIVLSSESQSLIRKYNQFAKLHTEIILSILPSFGLRPIDGVEWRQVSDALNKGFLDGLSPVQLLCASWLKRIKVTNGDVGLTVEDYFKKRKNETKTFENNIRLMYDYYRDKINRNIVQRDLYDICVNVN